MPIFGGKLLFASLSDQLHPLQCDDKDEPEVEFKGWKVAVKIWRDFISLITACQRRVREKRQSFTVIFDLSQ